LKYLVVISALFLLFKPVFPVVEYVLDYDYVVNVLCENKAKPELACNGKCHLMKELAKASDTEKTASEREKKGSFPIELFCNTSSEIKLASGFPVKRAPANFFYPTPHCVSFDADIFHPPASI